MKQFRYSQHEMKLQALMWLPDDGPIIELGCRRGNFAEMVRAARRIDDYTGIDINRDHIKAARNNCKNMHFIKADITKNKVLLERALGGCVVSFQTLEHIGKMGSNHDIDVVGAIPAGVPFIFSVPNFKSADHKRWFDKKGWLHRYKHLLDYEDTATYMTNKPARARSQTKTYLIKAVRKGD